MRKVLLFFFWLFLFMLNSSGLKALPRESADPSVHQLEASLLVASPPKQFAVDERLKKNVEFWVSVYVQVDANHGLIHDAKYIDHVYEVIELPKSGETKLIREHKMKWKAVLYSLQRKQSAFEALTEDEKKVFDLFRDVNEPNKFLNAAHRKRLRFQRGQKDNFLTGLAQSGRYLGKMEQIFKKEGMPLELTRLPFVESSFNMRARSKVGASGIWQFMRSTGRLFLTVNDALDERNDPIRATEAAAKLLNLNYESLRNWPLAVTAYNHGRKGMMRAVRRVGSEELEELVSEYRSRSFGFASSNFFTEFLAAVEVEKHAEKYFGKIERDHLVDFVEVKIPDYVEFQELTRRLKVGPLQLDPQKLVELNPALTDLVYSGKLLVPKGYLLRIPCESSGDQDQALQHFFNIYAEIPNSFKRKAQRILKYGTKIKSVKHRRVPRP